MNAWLALLFGCIGGLVAIPIIVGIRNFLKNGKERIWIKREIKAGRFLRPIDPKDFNCEGWKEEIRIEEKELKNLNKDIFKKHKPEEIESE